MKKKYAAVVSCILAAVLILGGCSNSSDTGSARASAENPATSASVNEKSGFAAMRDAVVEDAEVAYDHASEEPAEAAQNISTGGGGEGGTVSVAQERKLVRNVNLTIQTKEYDAMIPTLLQRVEDFGGYIENSMTQNVSLYDDYGARYGYFAVRIPAERLDAFLGNLGDAYHVTRTETSVNDITDSYYDTQARLDSLLDQERRLEELAERATELTHLLQIESELSNVRYQIENFYSYLQRMDNQVNMCSIWIDVQEVVEYTPIENMPMSFTERLGRAFAGSWDAFVLGVQNMVVFVAWNLPGMIVLLVVLIIAVGIVRKARRKRKLSALSQPGGMQTGEVAHAEKKNEASEQADKKE